MKDWMAHHSRVDQLRDLRNIAGGRLQIVRVAADTVAELPSQLVSHATALWRRAKYAVG